MTIDYIVDYVMNSPMNTNRKVLIDLLESLDIEVENKKYSVEEIVNYVMNSSYNTNKAVLIDMIESINKDDGGGEEEWLAVVNNTFDINEESFEYNADEKLKGMANLLNGYKVKVTIEDLNQKQTYEGVVGLKNEQVNIYRHEYDGGILANVTIYIFNTDYEDTTIQYLPNSSSVYAPIYVNQTIKIKIEYQK